IRVVAPQWKGSTESLRIYAFVGFFIYSMISGIFTVIRVSKKRAEIFGQFAAAVSGTMTDSLRRTDYRIDGHETFLTIDRTQQNRGTNRLVTSLPGAKEFQIQVLSGGVAARFLMSKGVLSPVFSLAVKQGPGPQAEREAGVQQLGYLLGEPLKTGDESF